MDNRRDRRPVRRHPDGRIRATKESLRESPGPGDLTLDDSASHSGDPYNSAPSPALDRKRSTRMP